MAKFPWLMKIMSEVVWGKLDRKKKQLKKKNERSKTETKTALKKQRILHQGGNQLKACSGSLANRNSC